MESRAEEQEENRFPWLETLALVRGKCGELVGREGHNVAGSFKVVGEEASTRIDVGFRRGSCVGPREGTKGRWETRRCHG